MQWSSDSGGKEQQNPCGRSWFGDGNWENHWWNWKKEHHKFGGEENSGSSRIRTCCGFLVFGRSWPFVEADDNSEIKRVSWVRTVLCEWDKAEHSNSVDWQDLFHSGREMCWGEIFWENNKRSIRRLEKSVRNRAFDCGEAGNEWWNRVHGLLGPAVLETVLRRDGTENRWGDHKGDKWMHRKDEGDGDKVRATD